MMAEIFMGIFFNLSFWYKLTDQTWWGAIISAIGAAVMIAVNVIFVPRYGYMACAWGGFAGYGVGMLLSYFLGQKKAPVPYDIRTMGAFLLLALALYAASLFIRKALGLTLESPFNGRMIAWLGINTALLAVYGVFTLRSLKRR